MPSRFEERFQAVAVPNFNREFGVTVRFIQDSVQSEEFTARRSAPASSVLNTGYGVGIGISVVLRDYILPVASVAINGTQVDPKPGSRIMEGDAVFEIHAPDEGTPSIELQAGGYEWVVRTKQVKS